MNGPTDEKVDGAVPEHDDVTSERVIDPAFQAATWDPYEVWLTRVKQPRDRAAASQVAVPVRRGDSVS